MMASIVPSRRKRFVQSASSWPGKSTELARSSSLEGLDASFSNGNALGQHSLTEHF